MSREPTTKLLESYLKLIVERQGSDLFFITGAPLNMKLQGKTDAIAKEPFEPGQVQKLAYSLLSNEQIREFEIDEKDIYRQF